MDGGEHAVEAHLANQRDAMSQHRDMGLPDCDYYSNPTLASQKAQYQVDVAILLRLAAWPEPETRAREIVELEARIAEAIWTKADRGTETRYTTP
jgi:predicted metalloendopeptidase